MEPSEESPAVDVEEHRVWPGARRCVDAKRGPGLRHGHCEVVDGLDGRRQRGPYRPRYSTSAAPDRLPPVRQRQNPAIRSPRTTGGPSPETREL